MRTKRATNCAIAPKCCVATLSRGVHWAGSLQRQAEHAPQRTVTVSRPLGDDAKSRQDRLAQHQRDQPCPSAQTGSVAALQPVLRHESRPVPPSSARCESPQVRTARFEANAPTRQTPHEAELHDQVGRVRDAHRATLPKPQIRERGGTDRGASAWAQGSSLPDVGVHSRRGRGGAMLTVTQAQRAEAQPAHGSPLPPGPEAQTNPTQQLKTLQTKPTLRRSSKPEHRTHLQPENPATRARPSRGNAEVYGATWGCSPRDAPLVRPPQGTTPSTFGACVGHVAARQQCAPSPPREQPRALLRFPQGFAWSAEVERRYVPSPNTHGVSTTWARGTGTTTQRPAQQQRSTRPRQFPWR